MGKLVDLTGQRFGRLTVLERAENSPSQKVQWLCRCDCGNACVVRGNDITAGRTLSCGCLHRERATALARRHDGRYTRLYKCWMSMRWRCENPNSTRYPRYGGRGITVCPEWHDFTVFRSWALANGYGDNLTLDRIDNIKGYSPDNCRWADAKTQANNKENNVVLTYRGKSQTVAQWADELGLSYSLLISRVECGWSPKRTLTEPVDNRKSKRKIGPEP